MLPLATKERFSASLVLRVPTRDGVQFLSALLLLDIECG